MDRSRGFIPGLSDAIGLFEPYPAGDGVGHGSIALVHPPRKCQRHAALDAAVVPGGIGDILSSRLQPGGAPLDVPHGPDLVVRGYFVVGDRVIYVAPVGKTNGPRIR